MKRDTRELAFLSLPCEHTRGEGLLQVRKRVLTRNGIGWYRDLGLSSLPDCEE